MEISRGAVGVIAGLCLGAGVGGAYLFTHSAAIPVVTNPPVAVGLDAPPPSRVASSETHADSRPPAPSAAVPVAARRATPVRPPFVPARPTSQTLGQPPRLLEPNDASPPSPQDSIAAGPLLPEPVPVVEPAPPARETAAPQFEELTIAADSVIGLRIDMALTSEQARVEDAVVASVTRDVRVGERVAIPAGARVQGEVTLVERGGRLRERARLGIRFTSIVLADGTRVPIETDAIYRDGDDPSGEGAAKVSAGAIGGALIGGLLGGTKGAILGGVTGAGAGSAAVLAGGRNPARLPSGAPVTVRLTSPVTVTVELQ